MAWSALRFLDLRFLDLRVVLPFALLPIGLLPLGLLLLGFLIFELWAFAIRSLNREPSFEPLTMWAVCTRFQDQLAGNAVLQSGPFEASSRDRHHAACPLVLSVSALIRIKVSDNVAFKLGPLGSVYKILY